MQKILIATGNPTKLVEMKATFEGLPYEFLGLKDLGLMNDCGETGKTYEENARIKAEYFFEKIGGEMPVIADDSGLVVDALEGELGVFTRRWGAGEHASDQQWLDYFMQRMEGLENRKASFVSYGALRLADKVEIFSGQTFGVITEKVEAEIKPGLPLSSVFLPNGHNKVYSAMSDLEKTQISHRGYSMNKVREYLEKYAITF
ncbi:hypothetical protein GF376_00450 [Candidatus Peregrinibacteria bacterium]|nr:hypothetical protein [Candidatus Peregrinibacteria bacterium]